MCVCVGGGGVCICVLISHPFVIPLICSVAKFRGVTFIRMEEEHFKEMGLPVGTRLFLEELVKQVCSHSSLDSRPNFRFYIGPSEKRKKRPGVEAIHTPTIKLAQILITDIIHVMNTLYH